MAHNIHSYAVPSSSRRDEREEHKSSKIPTAQRSSYHTTTSAQNGPVTIILGLGALSLTSYAASSAIAAYKDYAASQPQAADADESASKESTEKDASKEEPAQQQEKSSKGTADEPRENVFSSWFGVGVGAKYYEGGFEEVMTRREAALILGVRETTSPARIKVAHRKLLILNHPDTGGSTYLSGKLNEAKELLLKGRRS